MKIAVGVLIIPAIFLVSLPMFMFVGMWEFWGDLKKFWERVWDEHSD